MQECLWKKIIKWSLADELFSFPASPSAIKGVGLSYGQTRKHSSGLAIFLKKIKLLSSMKGGNEEQAHPLEAPRVSILLDPDS